MYAIIETGGKQYKVEEGEIIFIEKLQGEEGDTVTFDKVLAISDEDKLNIGTPLLDGATVIGNIVKHGKDKKIIVFKYKPKKGYRRKQGHRQPYTKVEIESINETAAKAKKKAAKKAEESEAMEAAEITEAVETVEVAETAKAKKTAKTTKTAKTAKTEKAEKVEKAEKTEKVEKAEKTEKTEKVAKTAKTQKTAKADKTTKEEA